MVPTQVYFQDFVTRHAKNKGQFHFWPQTTLIAKQDAVGVMPT